MSRNIVETKFFGIVLNEVANQEVNTGPKVKDDVSPVRTAKDLRALWKDTDKNIDYLRTLLSEVEQRRLFAIMCLSPDKIANTSAVGLTKIVSDLTGIVDKIKDDIVYLERRSPKKDNEKKLSDEERTKIDQFIKRAA